MSLETLETELSELRARMEWFDEERRKNAKRLAELEQRVELRTREIEARDQRIGELERQLADVKAQLGAIASFQAQINQTREEFARLVDEAATRRLEAEQEIKRLQRLEIDNLARELAELKKLPTLIGRLENNLEQRRVEESRLGKLIATVQNRFPPIDSRLEALSNQLAYLQETSKQHGRGLTQVETALLEVGKRWEPLETRLALAVSGITRTETSVQGVAREFGDLQRQVKEGLEQVRLADYQHKQRLDEWERAFGDYRTEMARFNKEWLRFAEQSKTAETAVQAIDEWRRQIELQQREVAELTRVELNRMRGQWQEFVADNQKQWKGQEVEAEQRWQSAVRRDHELGEQLHALLEKLDRLEQDKETLWRVQSAQSDAIKRLPLLWLEEVDKAIQNNPQRRRQPALVPVREE